jgi:DNA polymerase III epsilon subunit-like protein
MINNLLIIDIETTGLSPEQGSELIEVGAILYNVPLPCILTQVSTLLPVRVIGQEETHKISLKMANSVNHNVLIASNLLLGELVKNADYAISHGAAFDKQFFATDLQWLCTYEDFRFTPYKPSSLINLALHHGITIKIAHRALTDCGLIAEILSKRDDLEELIANAIARANSPRVWVRALVDYNNRDKAKQARFEWDGQSWKKEVKECDLENLVFDWELIK